MACRLIHGRRVACTYLFSLFLFLHGLSIVLFLHMVFLCVTRVERPPFRTIYLMSHYLFLLCFIFLFINWRVCTYTGVLRTML